MSKLPPMKKGETPKAYARRLMQRVESETRSRDFFRETVNRCMPDGYLKQRVLAYPETR